MPLEIVVDTAARILRARYTGEIGVADRHGFARQVLEKAQRTGIYRWLLDFRQAQSRGSAPAEIRRMADEFTPQFPHGVRMAYLLSYDHQLDDSLESIVRSRGVLVERFHDLDAAVAWLQAGDTDAANAPESPESPAARRAFRLVDEAIDPAARLSPEQFTAIGELIDVLLAAGIDDATVARLARRMSAAMSTPSRT